MSFLPHRTILRITGPDRKTFLQGLITNDILKLTRETPLYSALLSPQGKVLFDFILIEEGDAILMDCWKEKVTALKQRLEMYKLRAQVKITQDESLKVHALTAMKSGLTIQDPRHSGLGMRSYCTDTSPANNNFESLRLGLGIPESQDFIEDRSFPIEFGMANLHAISFNKGCYVGQEVVARSRSRATINKALHRVQSLEGSLPPPGTPVMSGSTEIGQLRSSYQGVGLAVLRLDGVLGAEKLMAGDIAISATLPDWFSVPTPVMQAP